MKYGKMMKGIGVAALALTVVSSCMVGGTLAKYTTTATGTGSAIVAKWAPSFKGGTNGTFQDSIDVKLTDTSLNGKVVGEKVAPGTDGSFSVQVSRGATEVEFTYSVTISDLNNCPANLKFYKDSNFTTELTKNAQGNYELVPDDGGKMGLTDSEKTLNVYWKWPYAVDSEFGSQAELDRDAADSEAGNKATASEAAATMSFKVNCTATQVNSDTTATP